MPAPLLTERSTERLPGDLFRAMGDLYLRKNSDVTRYKLATDIQRHLARRQIPYSHSTLRRQLNGTVDTVSPEVEVTMRSVLIASNGLRTPTDIDRALAAAGLSVPESRRLPAHIGAERFRALFRLWRYLEAGTQQRHLVLRLVADLAAVGIRYHHRTIEKAIEGIQHLVPRAVHERLLANLALKGVGSEEEALKKLRELETSIRLAEEAYEYVPTDRFRTLVRLWKSRHCQSPSLRPLAAALHRRAVERGIRVSRSHVEHLIYGDAEWVRRNLIEVLDEIVRDAFPRGTDLDAEAARLAESLHANDLSWVSCEAIEGLARRWFDSNPAATRYRLSHILEKAIRRLGYQTSYITLQLTLAGKKATTRGYVYRALARLVTGRRGETIPAEALSNRGATAPPPPLPYSRPNLAAFVDEVRRYINTSRSPHWLDFMAFRAERWYGLPREEFHQRVLKGKLSAAATKIVYAKSFREKEELDDEESILPWEVVDAESDESEESDESDDEELDNEESDDDESDDDESHDYRTVAASVRSYQVAIDGIYD